MARFYGWTQLKASVCMDTRHKDSQSYYILQDVGPSYERSKWAVQLGPFLKLWDSLTPSLSSIVKLTVPKAASKSPLDAFLISEVAFAQQLVATAASSLSSLSDLVLGSGVLTPTVQVCRRRSFCLLWTKQTALTLP